MMTSFRWLFPSKRSSSSSSYPTIPSLLHVCNKLPPPSPRPGPSFLCYSILHVASPSQYGSMFYPQRFLRQCQCNARTLRIFYCVMKEDEVNTLPWQDLRLPFRGLLLRSSHQRKANFEHDVILLHSFSARPDLERA